MSKGIVDFFKQIIPGATQTTSALPNFPKFNNSEQDADLGKMFPSGSEQLKEIYEKVTKRNEEYDESILKAQEILDSQVRKRLLKFASDIERGKIGLDINEAKDKFVKEVRKAAKQDERVPIEDDEQDKWVKIEEICGNKGVKTKRLDRNINKLPEEQRSVLKEQSKKLRNDILEPRALRGSTKEDECKAFKKHQRAVRKKVRGMEL